MVIQGGGEAARGGGKEIRGGGVAIREGALRKSIREDSERVPGVATSLRPAPPFFAHLTEAVPTSRAGQRR
jgi:hypothetical protein